MRYTISILILFIFACDPTPVEIENLQSPNCNFGFIVNSDNETCSCPEGFVSIGTQECRMLEAGEYYSFMDNCVVDLGMIIRFDDSSLEKQSETISFMTVYYEKPDTLIDYPDFGLNTALIIRLPDGRDSISFDIGIKAYRKPDPVTTFGIAPWFEGIVVNRDTIKGRFRWGARGSGYPAMEEFDCPAMFTR